MNSPEILWAMSRALYVKNWRGSARIVKMLNYVIHKALLPFEAQVGKNIKLDHYALGVVVHPQVELGDDCRIYHHVTLASESWIGSEHKIVVGDRVVIGAHTVVVARSNRTLRIGDDAVIGAGSVVTKDVPAREVWAGNPARKIKDRII